MDAGAAIGPRFQIGIVPHVAAAQDGSGDAAISGDIGTKLRDQIAVLAMRWQAHFGNDRPADAALERTATDKNCGGERDLENGREWWRGVEGWTVEGSGGGGA